MPFVELQKAKQKTISCLFNVWLPYPRSSRTDETNRVFVNAPMIKVLLLRDDQFSDFGKSESSCSIALDFNCVIL